MDAYNHISTGYRPRRAIFTGEINTYNIWETRFINYLHTFDENLVTAIEPKIEDTEDHHDFAKHNRRAYAELTQVLDEKSLELIMTDSKKDKRVSLKILRSH